MTDSNKKKCVVCGGIFRKNSRNQKICGKVCCKKESQKKYHQTDKSKETRRKYQQSDKYKEYQRKYNENKPTQYNEFMREYERRYGLSVVEEEKKKKKKESRS